MRGRWTRVRSRQRQRDRRCVLDRGSRRRAGVAGVRPSLRLSGAARSRDDQVRNQPVGARGRGSDRRHPRDRGRAWYRDSASRRVRPRARKTLDVSRRDGYESASDAGGALRGATCDRPRAVVEQGSGRLEDLTLALATDRCARPWRRGHPVLGPPLHVQHAYSWLSIAMTERGSPSPRTFPPNSGADRDQFLTGAVRRDLGDLVARKGCRRLRRPARPLTCAPVTLTGPCDTSGLCYRHDIPR